MTPSSPSTTELKPVGSMSRPHLALSPAAAIPSSKIRAIAEIAEELPNTLRLFVGEDTRPTPDFIKAAAQAAIAADNTFYTSNAGDLKVRQTLAAHLADLHHVDLDPRRQIVITASGMNAIVLATQATLGPGTSAVVVTPCWPNLSASVRVTGADSIETPLALDGDRFIVDFDHLEAAIRPDTRLLALATPGNPTGWMARHEDFDRLANLCERHHLWLLVDSVYERIVYDGRVAPSPFAHPRLFDRLIVVNSMSKTYRMTGWRVGSIVGPPALIKATQALQEFAVSCVAGFVQAAARAAWLEGEPHIQEMQSRYTHHSQLTLDRLTRIEGVLCPQPSGGFYAFPRLDGLRDSLAFCQRLVRDYGVGFAPGAAFGAGGEGHIRICFAVEEAILVAALDKFERHARECLETSQA